MKVWHFGSFRKKKPKNYEICLFLWMSGRLEYSSFVYYWRVVLDHFDKDLIPNVQGQYFWWAICIDSSCCNNKKKPKTAFGMKQKKGWTMKLSQSHHEELKTWLLETWEISKPFLHIFLPCQCLHTTWVKRRLCLDYKLFLD